MDSIDTRNELDRDFRELVRDFAKARHVAGLRCVLYREHPDRRLCFDSTFTAKSFDLKQIRRRFGGGRYWLLVKRNRRIAMRRFDVEGDPVVRTGPTRAGATSGSALGSVIDNLQAELRVIRQRLESLEVGQQELRHDIASLAPKNRRRLVR